MIFDETELKENPKSNLKKLKNSKVGKQKYKIKKRKKNRQK